MPRNPDTNVDRRSARADRLRATGLSWVEIARRVGTDASTLRTQCADRGLPGDCGLRAVQLQSWPGSGDPVFVVDHTYDTETIHGDFEVLMQLVDEILREESSGL